MHIHTQEAQAALEWNDPEPYDALDEPEPVFLALPASMQPAAAGDMNLFTSAVLPNVASSLVAIGLSVAWGAYSFIGTPAVSPDGMIELVVTAPLVCSLLGLQLIHELAHWAAALRHRLQMRLPFLIPSAALGCAGGHAPLASYPSNRTALYDFSLAGPLAGGSASLLTFAIGLGMTATASDQAASLFPTLATTTLHCSLLGSLITEAFLGTSSPAADAASLPLHPLALAGFAGLLANALALLPVGRLDGGRAATAAYGRRSASTLGGLTLGVVVIASLVSDEPELLLLWMLTASPLFRQAEVPCVDEITPVDDARTRWLLPLLVLSATIVCPIPSSSLQADSFDQLQAAAQNSALW